MPKKKKLFKIKIDDILFKINYVIRKIKWISDITNWKKKISVDLEHKNIINNNFASKKVRKYIYIYIYILKYQNINVIQLIFNK